jgi:hypothetical protein
VACNRLFVWQLCSGLFASLPCRRRGELQLVGEVETLCNGDNNNKDMPIKEKAVAGL